MHNKSFTADSQATIVGGRNIGDEYFGAVEGVLFADLDVLAIGPVVTEVAEDFDRYWASGSSYPVNGLVPAADGAQIAELAASALRVVGDPATVAYVNALHTSTFVRGWNQGTLMPRWAVTRMISDDSGKGLGLAAPEVLMFGKLREIIGESVSQLDVVSPYFVPTAPGVAVLVALARRGVKVKVLTNALEATDVPVVHAGYAKWREELLRNGIALYELRRRSADVAATPPTHRFDSSGSSLHAKTFSVNRSRVFIGSFNFDPRSARLNTEMGFVIESPALAEAIEAVLAARVPTEAYEVRLTDAGQLQWTERRGGESVRHDTEPGSSAWQRTRVWFFSLLPVEWLL
jgi:putative cardiolipin synthase